MPITIVVRSASGGESPSLTFDGPRVVLGRSDGSDVRLPDPSVSLRHASIRAQGADFVIVDEGSTNGTWVGGIKLGPHTPRLVKTGDLVRLGRVWLEIAIGQRAPTPDLGLATRELALEEPVSLALAELEAAAAEVVPDAAAPPPPPPSIPASSGLPAGSVPPESRMAPAQQAPIAEVASRTATTVAQPKRRVWTAADVMVVTIAVSVIAASVAGLVWVLR